MSDKAITSVRLSPWACPVCGFNRGDKRHKRSCAKVAQREGKGKRFGDALLENKPDHRHFPDPAIYLHVGGGYVRGK